MAKPALGRGLGALLANNSGQLKSPAQASSPSSAALPGPGDAVRQIPIGQIVPCAFQPRKDFQKESIDELAESIKANGIVQPLLVRQSGNSYELIAGERRWRAAQSLGLSEVPAIVRAATDAQALELALVENLQRENLNPIEEALGYSQLQEQFHLTQEEISIRVGKSRTAITNALRLLKLPADLLEEVKRGSLSVGHAKVLLGLDDPSQQKSAGKAILKDALSVRQTEQLVMDLRSVKVKTVHSNGKPEQPLRDAHIAHLENKLTERFTTKVSLRYRQGKGSVEIRFFNDDDLERVLGILGVNAD
jgi:ParB family chromosome partitioning protein